jgi:hypothetical protein
LTNSNNVRTYTANELKLFELFLVLYRNPEGEYEIPRLEDGIIVDTPLSYPKALEYLALWLNGEQEESINFDINTSGYVQQ